MGMPWLFHARKVRLIRNWISIEKRLFLTVLETTR